MDMDILFIGGLFPKEIEMEIKENTIGNIQNAANNLQWELVNGLNEVNEDSITIINSLYIGSYPKKYKKILIPTYFFSHRQKAIKTDVNVGFLNLPGVKQISRYFSLKPYIKKWAIKDTGKPKVILAYAMTWTFVNALRYAKKINPSIQTTLIVPDLPQYMNTSSSEGFLYRNMKNLEIKLINENKSYIDSYVLLTKYMKNKLNIEDPYVVIEGISTELFKDIKVNENQHSSKRTILYTGSLNERYGIINLLEAFTQLENNDVELILCGKGDAESKIYQYTKIDKRIKYLGLVERNRILELQKSSTLLINPRANNEEYTKYSFPSKILEYMSSGTPVLAYKLDGIPDEYYDYIYIIKDEPNGLLKSLERFLNTPEANLKHKGKIALNFVKSNKNKSAQAEKILKMISKLI